MATYFIGDIHGCFAELMTLLDQLSYQPEQDQLWFAGDLVNRGAASLETLRWIKNQPNAATVLGNHDLHCLALYYGVLPDSKKHTLEEILQAPDCDELMAWLLGCPFYQYFDSDQLLLLHAGWYPGWCLAELMRYGDELAAVMRQDPVDFFQHMYGDEPRYWQQELSGHARYRFMVNAITRMRYLDEQLGLELSSHQAPPHLSSSLKPWFERIKQENLAGVRCLFGHWAALRGQVESPYVIALDGGCVWDGSLLAWCLETNVWHRVAKL